MHDEYTEKNLVVIFMRMWEGGNCAYEFGGAIVKYRFPSKERLLRSFY